MRKVQSSPAIIIISLVIAAAWAAFALSPKSQIIQTIHTKQQAIIESVKPVVPAKAAAKTIETIHVPILMYHHVGFLDAKADSITADLTVSPTDFEEQVKYFKNRGYKTVSLQQAYDALENAGPLPGKPIIFTFDDGYKDVFTNAVPILQKYGYTGTFAIATKLLGRPQYAVWDDITAAHNQGMEIVSHTENHLDLTSKIYSDYDLHREIFDSKQELESKLGIPIPFFVYPYGKYDDKVIGMLKEAGYKVGLTTAYAQDVSANSLLATGRLRVHGQDGLEKLKKVLGPVQHSAGVHTNL